jgi:hypothetical protein
MDRAETEEKLEAKPAHLPELAVERLQRLQRLGPPPPRSRHVPLQSSREATKKMAPAKTGTASDTKRLIREL